MPNAMNVEKLKRRRENLPKSKNAKRTPRRKKKNENPNDHGERNSLINLIAFLVLAVGLLPNRQTKPFPRTLPVTRSSGILLIALTLLEIAPVELRCSYSFLTPH